MSNLTFKKPINSFATARAFMEDAAHGSLVRYKSLCYATEVHERISWATGRPNAYTVTHHGNTIAEFRHIADVLYIPKWSDHRYGGKYANVYGIDQFHILATLDNCGYGTSTTADRLNRLIPEFAPRGLRITVRTITTEHPVYGGTCPERVMVATYQGYAYPFNTLHFTLSGDVIAYHDGKPYRVAQRRAVDYTTN